MKVAFFHDAEIVKNSSDTYYSTIFPYDVWKRYLFACEKLVVSTRIKCSSESDENLNMKYSVSSGDKVEFKPIESYKNVLDSFLNARKIRKEVRKILNETDCAIIRLPSVLGNFAYSEALKIGKPYAVEVVGSAKEAYWFHSFLGKLLSFNMHLKTKRGIRKAKFALYVTERYLQQKYPTDGISIGGCSNVLISSQPEQVLKDRLEKIVSHKAPDRMEVGLVGSLNVGYKGHLTAIKALSLLRKQGINNICLHFLGEGNKKKWISFAEKNDVLGNIVFDEILPNGEPVLNWMKSLDILIVPSYTEGMPRVIIEAMSLACPILGSDAGGIPELINSSALHHKKNAVELANGISRIAMDKDIAKKYAIENYNNAKKYTTEKLNVKRNAFWSEYLNYIKGGC